MDLRPTASNAINAGLELVGIIDPVDDQLLLSELKAELDPGVAFVRRLPIC